MSEDALRWLLLGALLALPAALALLLLLRLGRRADAIFRGRSMSTAEKGFWIALMLVGASIAIGGGWLVGLGFATGLHLGALGIAWFLSGIWVPAFHDRELMNGVRESGLGICTLGTLLMFIGIGLALFGPSHPVFGSGSWGDVIAFAGFAVHLGGLWVIAPGPGGIAVG
ncbi:MAG: hypothetical protein GVY11_05365 [Gammaproteobacteria bacterium]|jgi:hypothetical protein|nr:hypothetical protein [Gammaproteobacteria bacterium]